MSYVMKKKLANPNNYGGKRSTKSIKYLIYHFTANDGDSDEGNANYFHNNIVKASAHYFVDDDSVTQSVSDDHVAWSVGGAKYGDCSNTVGGKFYKKATNSNSISIEMCDTKKDGKVMATEATLANAAALGRKLMKKYNIDINHVIRHFDVNGKHCPAYFMNNAKWKQFKKRLSSTSTKTNKNESKPSITFKPYKVKVDRSDLNIRKGPGTNYSIVDKCAKGTYTIIKKSSGKGSDSGWGKLKSGAGWISLDYTKKN